MSQFAKVFALLAFFAAVSFAGPVSMWGALKACTDSNGKGRLCASKGAWNNVPVQVRGVSLGWSNTGWESAAFFNSTTVNAMVDGWKAEVIRVPYGEFDNNNLARVKTAIDAAIAKDVYVVVDFHSHTANNEASSAKTFFENIIAAYPNSPNIIFEIFNEPTNQSWATIKTYAETIISAIRAKNATNLILVGTPEYSARPSAAVGSFLTDSNVGYVFHFYADSHKTDNGEYDGYPSYSTGVTRVLNAGKPVFVTEYGTTNADGGAYSKTASGNTPACNAPCNYNTHNATASDAWFTYMDNNKISSCAWNVNDKKEGSAFFGTGSSFTQSAANYINESMMTASGKYIYNKLKGYEPSWKLSTPPTDGGGNGKTVIDDFEDGDGIANIGEPWYIYDDSEDQNGAGASTAANEKDEEGSYIAVVKDGSNWVAQVKDYVLRKGQNLYAPYIALGLDTKNNQKSYDLSKCSGGFSYRYKGVAHNFKIQQSDVTDFAYHSVEVSPASNSEWKSVEFILDDFMQPSWTTNPKVAFDLKKVEGFAWEIKGDDDGLAGLSGLTGSLMIDDFTCLGNMSLTPIRFSPFAGKSAAQLISNGISLQVQSKATLEIFNLNGSLLRKMDFSNGAYSVELSDLPKGLYIAKVRYGNSSKETLKVPVR